MSKLFKPDIPKPEPVKEVELKQVKDRGRTGRTVLGGLSAQQTETRKKTILGG